MSWFLLFPYLRKQKQGEKGGFVLLYGMERRWGMRIQLRRPKALPTPPEEA
jgi:hypothetical protein